MFSYPSLQSTLFARYGHSLYHTCTIVYTCTIMISMLLINTTLSVMYISEEG